MCMRQNTLQIVCMHGPTTACVKSTNIPAILLCACIKTLKYSLHAFAYCLLCQIHEYPCHHCYVHAPKHTPSSLHAGAHYCLLLEYPSHPAMRMPPNFKVFSAYIGLLLAVSIHEYLSHHAACMHLHGSHSLCILSKLTLIEIVFLGPFLLGMWSSILELGLLSNLKLGGKLELARKNFPDTENTRTRNR